MRGWWKGRARPGVCAADAEDAACRRGLCSPSSAHPVPARRAGLSLVDSSASSPLTKGCSLAIAQRDAKRLASSALLPLSPPQL